MRPSSIVIGFLLAIALAYIHDATTTQVTADGQRETIVNWEVLGRSVGGVVDWLRDQLGVLANQLHRPT